MAAARRPSTIPTSAALAVFLVVAFAIGLAATFLAAPSAQPGPTPAAQGPGAVSYNVIGWISVALIVVIVGGLIVRRLFARSEGSIGRPLFSYLVVFLLAVLFLVAVRFVDPGAVGIDQLPPPGSSPPPPPPGGNGTGANNSTFLPLPLTPHLPGWVLYVAIAVAALIAVLVVPVVVARRAPVTEPIGGPATVRRTLAEALAALSDPSTATPRDVVIRLYGQLLVRVGPRLESLEAATPREIERTCVNEFGIRADHARGLTALFEEARYSTHPFTDREVEQARSALALALDDLDRAGHLA